LQEMKKAEILITPDFSAPNNAASIVFRHQPLSSENRRLKTRDFCVVLDSFLSEMYTVLSKKKYDTARYVHTNIHTH
jgi:hypothetical protein